MSDDEKLYKNQVPETAEEENRKRQKSTVLLQGEMDTITDARQVQAVTSMLHEGNDGSTRVANDRAEDCPALIRAGAVAGPIVFALSIVAWFFVAVFTTGSTTAIVVVMGISLVVTIVCCGIQWYLNRRAWIRRMREQDAEKHREQPET